MNTMSGTQRAAMAQAKQGDWALADALELLHYLNSDDDVVCGLSDGKRRARGPRGALRRTAGLGQRRPVRSDGADEGEGAGMISFRAALHIPAGWGYRPHRSVGQRHGNRQAPETAALLAHLRAHADDMEGPRESLARRFGVAPITVSQSRAKVRAERHG